MRAGGRDYNRLVADTPQPSIRRLPFTAEGAIASAVSVLRRGGIVAFPTETYYGLAADPFNPEAMRRLMDVKGRPAGSPFPLMAPSLEAVIGCFPRLPRGGQDLARAFWPGPLTLAVPAPPGLHPATLSRAGAAAVRVPGSAEARQLAAAFGGLLTATSANVSGSPPATRPDEVARVLERGVDLLLDGGDAPGGAPSTVVDLSGEAPVLVRAGAVPAERIEAVLGRPLAALF